MNRFGLHVSILLLTAALATFFSGCAKILTHSKSDNLLESVINDDESLEMLVGIGRLAERNNKPDKAIEAYQAILKRHPQHTQSLHRLGVIDAKRGLTDNSIQWLKRAVQSETPSAELLGDLGYAYYLAGDLDSSKRYLSDGLARDPVNARMLNNLAIVEGSTQDYERAMDLFRQCGTEAEALASLAYIQSQTGHLSAAKQIYLQSLALDGSLEVAANGLMEIHKRLPSERSFPESTEPQFSQGSNIQLASFEQTASKNAPSDRKRHTARTASLETSPLVKVHVSSPETVKVGSTETYRVTVKNESNQTISDVQIELELHRSMAIANVTKEAWLDESTNIIAWKFPQLISGEIVSFEFEVNSQSAGRHHNQLTVFSNGQPISALTLSTQVDH